jgi:transposase
MLNMNRYELTNEQWAKLAPVLPPQKPVKAGRPANDHRRIINGILWILRSGAGWRDIPERYGSWSTVYSRFNRWQKKGIWQKILTRLQSRADQNGQNDWSIHFVDATIVRAHQHSAGQKNSSAEAEALGRSQGGVSTKIHLRSEGGGKLLNFILTPGQVHEAPYFEELMQPPLLLRVSRGRPRLYPRRVAADKGYTGSKNRKFCHKHHIGVTIPRRKTEKHKGKFAKPLYKLRNRVERLINRLKQHRRIATRYDKTAENYRAFWLIGAILLWC